MSRRKSSKKIPPPVLTPTPRENDFNFDLMEAKIRGDEILLADENKKRIELQKLNKELTDKEVDARLRDLIQKLGSPKKKRR